MKQLKITKIQFVWNADFGLAGGVKALRELAGGYHSCTLCGLAYHRVRQTPEWQAYKRELKARFPLEIREPCRNQLKPAEQAAAAGDFPTVLGHTPQGVVKLLSAREIDACKGNIASFRRRLDTAIDKLTHTIPAPRTKTRRAAAASKRPSRRAPRSRA